jgi:hypothetical protein
VKRALAVLVAAGVVVGGAAPAQAATKLERRVAALQRTLTAQKRTIAKLQSDVTKLKKQANRTAACPTSGTPPVVCQIAVEAAVVAYCDAAVTADAFQNTWAVINQVAGRTIFGPPVALSDEGLCAAIRVTRQQTLVPPTITPFGQILQRLVGRAAPFQQPYWLWGPSWITEY